MKRQGPTVTRNNVQLSTQALEERLRKRVMRTLYYILLRYSFFFLAEDVNAHDHEQPLVLSVTILEETVNTVWRQEEKKRLWTLHGDKRRRRDCGLCMDT